MLYAVKINGKHFDLNICNIGDILQYCMNKYQIEVYDFDDLEEALGTIGITYEEFIE